MLSFVPPFLTTSAYAQSHFAKIACVRRQRYATPNRARCMRMLAAPVYRDERPQFRDFRTSPRVIRALAVLRQLALLMTPLFIAAIFMCFVESWSLLDGLYFATTVATTVGYGDLAPTTTAGRLFVTLYALFCAARLGAGLGSAVDAAASAVVNEDGDATAESTALARVRATAAFLCVVLLGGCLLYAKTLGLAPLDALYFVAVSASTVGLGDVSPQTRAGRAFATAWLVFAALGLANMLSRYAEWRAAVLRRRSLELLTGQFNERAFKAMDEDGDNKLTQAEFLGYVFCKLGVVTEVEIQAIIKKFEDIDSNSSGTIDLEEVMTIEYKN